MLYEDASWSQGAAGGIVAAFRRGTKLVVPFRLGRSPAKRADNPIVAKAPAGWVNGATARAINPELVKARQAIFRAGSTGAVRARIDRFVPSQVVVNLVREGFASLAGDGLLTKGLDLSRRWSLLGDNDIETFVSDEIVSTLSSLADVYAHADVTSVVVSENEAGLTDSVDRQLVKRVPVRPKRLRELSSAVSRELRTFISAGGEIAGDWGSLIHLNGALTLRVTSLRFEGAGIADEEEDVIVTDE